MWRWPSRKAVYRATRFMSKVMLQLAVGRAHNRAMLMIVRAAGLVTKKPNAVFTSPCYAKLNRRLLGVPELAFVA
jgi:hypothetical protein